MKKQLSCIALAIALSIIPQFAYAQTQSYPSDEDLQNLMPDFQRQVDYWSQYEEPERQTEAKTFAENWSRRDPNIASFLGKWAAIEVPTRDFFSYCDHGSSVLEQFNAAGCIAEATNF